MEPKFFLILLLPLFLTPLVSSSNPLQQNTYTNFIKTSCTSATYPSVCRKTLLPYSAAVKTSPLRLVNAALSTTLRSAGATLSTVAGYSKTNRITKSEAAVLKDCVENIQDSIDELKSSIKVISGFYKSSDKSFLISNVQTWTSAAITDENTCLDGFSGRKVSPAVKKKIRESIVSLARLSSNALYLINHLRV